MKHRKNSLAKISLASLALAITGLHTAIVMAGGPVASVPEPSSLIMISSGVAALVIGGRFWWRK
jgi:integral membrane sensor domain MASE1